MKEKMRKLMIVLCIVFILDLSATVINIPADYPTIQQGLNAAVAYDTVLVATGTYFENIIWPDTNGIKLFGSGEDDCIIDGSSISSVIRFDSQTISFEESTLIEGFTIQNGYAHGTQRLRFGGGIFLMNASICLKNLIINNNSAVYGGGIMCFNYSDANLDNVIITNNRADENGGGLLCKWTSHAVLTNVVISNNESTFGYGGGIAVGDISEPYIFHTLISNNTAVYGGGVYFEKGNCDLINCTIVNNYATNDGGGVYCFDPSNKIENSILWNNYPNQLVNEADITYTDFQCGWPGVGNIDLDPLFIDAANENYHLTINSPCIDSGNPESPYDPDNTIADMGAFYYNQGTGIGENFELQNLNYSLDNHPNPFNPSTTINFSISKESNVELTIFNIKGQKVKQLVSNSANQFSAGQHSVVWNGTDENNQPVSSGVYFYKMKLDGKNEAVKKCLLLK
jgi:hypothetical protein